MTLLAAPIWGVLFVTGWVLGLALFYLAFTTSYLAAALGWQAWKKGKALWKRI